MSVIVEKKIIQIFIKKKKARLAWWKWNQLLEYKSRMFRLMLIPLGKSELISSLLEQTKGK